MRGMVNHTKHTLSPLPIQIQYMPALPPLNTCMMHTHRNTCKNAGARAHTNKYLDRRSDWQHSQSQTSHPHPAHTGTNTLTLDEIDSWTPNQMATQSICIAPLHPPFVHCCYSLLISSMHSHFNNSTHMYILPQLTGDPAHWLCTGTPLYIVSLLLFYCCSL